MSGASTAGLQAFIFDFGGVFTDSPFTAVHDFAGELGADPRALTQIVFGPYESDSEHPWHRLERGEITLHDARLHIRELGKAQALDVDIFTLFKRMEGEGAGSGARAALVERVRGLRRQGFRTAMITNNVREFGEGWRSLIPVDELFELVIDSSAVGLRKPDPRIFELVLRELGIPAPACVFLDDYAGNLVAARALGLRTILVGPDVQQTIADIDALLANPPATAG